MADDVSPNKGEMHYTTPINQHDQHWQSICNERNSNGNGYSSEDESNSPLDFSFKRKNGDNEISGSDSVPSPASTNDTGIHLDDRKMSNSDNEDKSFINVKKIKSEQDSEQKHDSINWSINPSVANMISAFQAGLFPSPMLGPLPSVAALMGPRLSQNRSASNRPFKSYPKDHLTMGGFGLPGFVPKLDSNALQNLNLSSEEFFNLYRQHMLLAGEREKHIEPSTSPSQPKHTSNITATSSPSSSSTISPSGERNAQLSGMSASERRNYTSSRKRPRTLPDEQKDESYWERRRKNNEAAKRSRDMRRAKEDEIAIRAALLEQENLKLRVEVAALKTETAKLRCMLYNS